MPKRTIRGTAAKLKTGISQAHSILGRCLQWRSDHRTVQLKADKLEFFPVEDRPADHAYHRMICISSTFIVERFRYMRRMMANARPTSAAAMVMTKIAIT